MGKKKIAFIVQRYGVEVNGGAEYHCRILAERVASLYDVDVLTSMAKDYRTWENEYPEAVETLNGVNVLRFPTLLPRNDKKFRSLSRKFANRKPHLKILKFLGLLRAYLALVPSKTTSADSYNWAKYQGPYMPTLINYLKETSVQYDAMIFFTYLYYPTIFGLDVDPKRSILIPTAHDEPPIYFPVFKTMFSKPAAILYNSAAEKRFVNEQFQNHEIYNDIVGVGIEKVEPAGRIFAQDILKSNAPYLIYIGRIDASKGCKLMCDYFLRYKKEVQSPLKLVLIGQAFMDVPVNSDLVCLGFVDEDVKISLLQQSEALIIPSFYESLSMVTLESMAQGIPVIANGRCEVLKDHIEQSDAGFLFTDYTSFQLALKQLSSADTDLTQMKKNAFNYVQKNYDWQIIVEKLSKSIEYVSKSE